MFNFTHRDEVGALEKRVISYLDLTYCLEGEMEYYIDGERVVLHGGDAILYPPGSERMRVQAARPAYYASFNIIMPDSFECEVSGHLPGCIGSDTVYILELFKREYSSASAYSGEKCTQIFMYLYYKLMEHTLDRENPHIKLIKRYIGRNISQNLALEKIAGHVHLEVHYMCGLFKKHTGMTVTQYIIGQRIDLAKRLIIAKASPLHEIAAECGFGSYKYFSQTFHEVTGMTAMQYKKTLTVK